jgi:hypothetical protein
MPSGSVIKSLWATVSKDVSPFGRHVLSPVTFIVIPQPVYRNIHPLAIFIIPVPFQSWIKDIYLRYIAPFCRGNLDAIITSLLAATEKKYRSFSKPKKPKVSTSNV